MFYAIADGLRPPPLTHNPLNAIVMPRPIGWISSVSAAGVLNLAPYSYFNLVSADPPYVMFAPNSAAAGTCKDTYRNVCEVPEFVVNVVSEQDLAAMNASSAPFPPEVDEFAACGITSVRSTLVRPPRVASARAALECRVYQVVHLPPARDGRESHVVVGEVLGVYVADAMIVNGQVDERRMQPVTRLGYMNYGTLGEVFELLRPQ